MQPDVRRAAVTYDDETKAGGSSNSRRSDYFRGCGGRESENLRFYERASDKPNFCALTAVAPRVRFNSLAIFFTPCLSLAIDFNVRKSSLVHARRTAFFFFAISVPF